MSLHDLAPTETYSDYLDRPVYADIDAEARMNADPEPIDLPDHDEMGCPVPPCGSNCRCMRVLRRARR